MKEIDQEEGPSVRANKSKETGFTGLSILHQLNSLYGFNIMQNLVFDAIHNISLNVASHHLHYYFNEVGIGPVTGCTLYSYRSGSHVLSIFWL